MVLMFGGAPAPVNTKSPRLRTDVKNLFSSAVEAQMFT